MPRKEIADISRKFSGLLGEIWLTEQEAYDLNSVVYWAIRRRTKVGVKPCPSTTNIPAEKIRENLTVAAASIREAVAPVEAADGVVVTAR